MSTREERSARLPVGPLDFDVGSGELTGPTGRKRIAPQPASLLEILASRAGGVVSRDEIRELLWPGGKVEFEQGIAFALREVRKAIEAVGGDPALIETIPKRGFRIAVTAPAAEDAPATDASAVKDASQAAAVAPGRWKGMSFIAPVAVALLAIIGIGTFFAGRESSPGALRTVAVFVHDVEDEAHAALAGAIGFELTTELTSELEGRFGVVGPSGTSELAGPDDTDGAIAVLGACLVVSGGIRAVGTDSVVVFTQVVRALDRVHVWARQDTALAANAARVVVPTVVEGVNGTVSGC